MKVNINKFTGFCGCGKEHKILVKDIIIESEAIKKLPEIMEKEGFKNITIICDENTYMAAGEEVEEVVLLGWTPLPKSYFVPSFRFIIITSAFLMRNVGASALSASL